MRERRAVIVGAGVGGLAAGALLARAGVRTTVIEAQARPGGKMRELEVGAAKIDSGPTVFTMRWALEAVFEEAGGALGDDLRLARAHILARHAWSDGARLDLFADLEASADAVAAFAGAREARAFREFHAEAARIYEVLKAPFLEAPRPTPLSLAARVGLHRVGDLLAIRPFETMMGALARTFRDQRLRQLFGRYATYCGSSPFAAPATLMLVAHVEQDGVWLVEGGMARLADALQALGARAGAQFRFEERVVEIETAGGAATGVRLASGERIPADVVVMNADPSALAAGLFGAAAARVVRAPPRGARSLSAITWSLDARAAGFPLVRHNVFFSDNYAAEFRDLAARRPPGAPTIYVCAQDRSDQSPPIQGRERIFALMNAPAIGDGPASAADHLPRWEEACFARLAACGLDVERQDAPRIVTTPWDFHRLFPGTGGALYGRASHGWAASFLRPSARTAITGLYLAGGSVHPGPGVPMAALSGRTAARAALTDLASTRTSLPAATRGGILTPSATTAPTD